MLLSWFDACLPCQFKLPNLRALYAQGTVRLLFQPAEEGGAGGDLMVKEGEQPPLPDATVSLPFSSSAAIHPLS